MKISHVLILKFFFAFTMVLWLGGCSENADEQKTENFVKYEQSTLYTGTFVDAPVKGLKYETKTQSGYTDEKGKFQYTENEYIAFYLGDLFLGQVKARKLITPYTLRGDSPSSPTYHTVNIAILLQNCDRDTRDAYIDVDDFKNYQFGNAIDLDDAPDDFINELRNEGFSISIDKESALKNLNITLGFVASDEGDDRADDQSDDGDDGQGDDGADDQADDGDNNQTDSFVIPAISSQQKKEFLDAVNAARAQEQDCGVYGKKPAVGTLKWNDKLYKAAYTYNYDMVHGNAWHHRGSNTDSDIVAQAEHLGEGSHMRDRIEYYKYDFYYIGENIAKGYQSVSDVVAGWIDSDGHCKNLMDPHFTELGMSLLESDDSNDHYGKYWTQDFGQPKY